MPIAGSAIVVVAGGALAPVAHAAPAAPEADAGFGALGGTQGQFESCEAFFGFGKELVAFSVVDQNGADGVAHAVPTDTQVVFLLEDEEGDEIECLPVELTEDDWDSEFSGAPFDPPAFPGPGHYVYPSIEQGASIDDGDFGTVESAGFYVQQVPAGHTLVSPTVVVDLFQSQLNGESLLFLNEIDPRTLAHITDEVGAAAAGAFEDAVEACDVDGSSPLTDDDLADAVGALEALTGEDRGSLDCNDIAELNLDASIVLGLQESIAYTEAITLSLPVQATTTTAAPVTTTTAAVSPSTVARVLARTGAGRSSSLPTALVGFASIAGGTLVLGARRRLRGSR
jgi:hypothetical protein